VQCTESPPRPRSALDNNLTQRLSIRDPIAIVRVKALVAATTNLSIAFVAGAPLPSGAVLAAGLGLGAVSYGLSIVLDTYALRYVGAAREAAYFSTAPFFGGAVAVIVLGDRLGLREGAAGLAMALGVIGLLRARPRRSRARGSRAAPPWPSPCLGRAPSAPALTTGAEPRCIATGSAL